MHELECVISLPQMLKCKNFKYMTSRFNWDYKKKKGFKGVRHVTYSSLSSIVKQMFIFLRFLQTAKP